MAQQTYDVRANYADVADESFTTDADARTRRAIEQDMVVIPGRGADGVATGMYDVHSQSGSTYIVDLAGDEDRPRCDCPDVAHNDPEDGCKHARRVQFLVDKTALPEQGESADEYMDQLGALEASLNARRENHCQAIRQIDSLLDVLE